MRSLTQPGGQAGALGEFASMRGPMTELAHARWEGGTCQADWPEHKVQFSSPNRCVSPHVTDEKTGPEGACSRAQAGLHTLGVAGRKHRGLCGPCVSASSQPGSRNTGVWSLSAVTPEGTRPGRGRFGRDGGQ